MLEVIKLPRGGYVITSEGKLVVQIGIPPETIKDTVKLFGEALQYYIVPKRLIDTTSFLNTAEIEFPVYYNYFVKKRKTFILCAKEQENILKVLFKESLIGPEKIEEDDFGSNVEFDIQSEMLFFRRKDQKNKNDLFETENSVEFINIEEDLFIEDIKIKKIGEEIFFFRNNKQEELVFEGNKLDSLPYDFSLGLKKPFDRKKLERALKKMKEQKIKYIGKLNDILRSRIDIELKKDQGNIFNECFKVANFIIKELIGKNIDIKKLDYIKY